MDHSAQPFIGNTHAKNYLQSIVQSGRGGFILLVWPRYVGKKTLIWSIINNLVDPTYQYSDYRFIADLTDQWATLKKANDSLTGTEHTIKIDTDEKKQSIKLSDESFYQDWWVRTMIEWLNKTPIWGTKVLTIENMERITTQATNALLKTLEEPYPDRWIIGTSSRPHLLLDTVLSRALIVPLYEVVDGDPWWLGRPWLRWRIEHEPRIQELDECIKSLIVSRNKESMISTVQVPFMRAYELWLLDLFLDVLCVHYCDQPPYLDKLLRCKRLLTSNVGVNQIILNTLL